MTFQELKLSRQTLRAVKEAGYTEPSPIQAGAIPPVLAGRDLMGCAQTGTGKTAAFALPMLERLTAQPPRAPGKVRALILTPTRELALQIGESFEAYGKYLTLRSAVIFGGVGQAPQVEALKKGVDILVACPGRLNDLIGQGLADLSGVEIFVLDEADRMLDMGFVHDVKKVIAKLPARRQNLMFSATMPREIEELASGILHDPAFVKVDPVSSTVDRIAQSLYFVEKAEKRKLLPWLLQNLEPPVQNALVFSRTKHGADKIARELVKAGIPAAAIHGNKSQSARVAALEGFKAGKTRVLVATDIAARGIDISELSHVFNFDLPEVPETYVHRIGRTARAGADGTAVSFCASEEREYLAGIEKLNRKKIPVVKDHPWANAAGQQDRNEESDMTETEKQRAPQNAENAGRRPRRPRRENGAEQPGSRPVRGSNMQPKFDPHFLSLPEESAPVRQPAAPAPAAKETRQPAAAPKEARQEKQRQPRAPKNQNPQNAPQRAEKPEKNANPANPANQKNNAQPAAARNNNGQQSRAAQKNSDKNGGRQQNQPAAANNAPRGAKNAQQPARQPERSPAQQPAAPREKNGRPQSQPAAPAPRAAKNNAQPQRPASAPARRAAQDEDTGLRLISRRPPQQKFASFEEYMAARGGATAPIEDYSQE